MATLTLQTVFRQVIQKVFRTAIVAVFSLSIIGWIAPQAVAQKQVALFYFSVFGHTMYQDRFMSPTGDSWIMKGQNPAYGPNGGTPHFWGKPLWAATHGDGTLKNNYLFYFNGDPDQANNALLDYHAELITQAGVDFVILDFTNGAADFTDSGPSYISGTKALCKRWQERMNAGLPTPKIAFFAYNEATLAIIRDTYFNAYRTDLFYEYLGKKLALVAKPLDHLGQGDAGQPAVPTHGIFANYTTRHCWGLDNSGSCWQFKVNSNTPPPPFMYNGQPEQMSAPVSTQASYMTTDGVNLTEGAVGRQNGAYFSKYMDAAKAANVKFVFIHSWNEWAAGNWSSIPAQPTFVDQWLTEYSSDIEPMSGGHGSAYYDLMKQKIAEFKGINPQSPYANVIPIPGIVEAENFDNGGESIAYHDTTPPNLIGPFRNTTGVDTEPCSEGGTNLAFSDNGEWLEYTVNVATTRAYTLAARVSSPLTTGRFHIEIDGVNVTGALAVPNTGGWQTWANVSKIVNLTAGQHIMRFVIDAKEFNTNKFTFTAQGTPPVQTQTPYAEVIGLPGVVEAENFDNGGESMAYHDTEEANLGGVQRTTGPDVFTCTSSEATNALGWINNGEWVEYSVNAATAGSYNINARVASVFNTGVFHLEWDGNNVSGPIAVPNTGDWQAWQSVTKAVTLTAGQHILRIFADGGNFNLNKITFSTGIVNPDPFPISGSVYRLVNRQSKLVLDVSACSLENGMKVQQWAWLGGNCQRWKFTATDNGYYKVTAQHSNQALEIGSALTTDGAKANQWPSNDCFCQQWKVEATSGGFYKLTARHSTQVLEVGNALMTDGAQVNQFPWNTAACQQWLIEPVPAFARQGVEEVTATASLKLSPNPASDQVNVTWEGLEGEAITLTVVNALGQVVHQQGTKGISSHQMNTSQFGNGLYIVSLHSGKQVLRQKLNITHE
ncbi:MAG: carbohydrate-binding protein [Bacteroidota bacterium]